MENHIIIPEITKGYEKIDLEKFNTLEENVFIKTNNDNEYVKTMVQSYGYAKHIIFENTFFSIAKQYFNTNGIKSKGIIFNNGSRYGTWYEFDEKGNLIKEINTDEGFDFGWEEIIKFCRKNGAVLEKGYPKRGGIKTEIYKNEEEGNKVWTISYYNTKTDEYLEVTLDGKTGKEIKSRPLELIGN